MRVGEPENFSVKPDELQDFVERSRILEEVEENDTGAPRMYAYEYDAKTNELNQVRIVTNPAEEDYLGIQTKEVQTEATGENQDITVDTNDLVSEKTVDATPDGVNISTSEPVGHNVDVKL